VLDNSAQNPGRRGFICAAYWPFPWHPITTAARLPQGSLWGEARFGPIVVLDSGAFVGDHVAVTTSISDFPVPHEGILATHLVVAADLATTTRFYSEQLGGEVVWSRDDMMSYIKLANTWVIVVGGGDGTPDKPDVTLAPPDDHNRFDAFMNIRVADIDAIHREWSERGVEFITPPLDNQGYEIRCYIRDPDGRIIEVGQHTGMLSVLGLAES